MARRRQPRRRASGRRAAKRKAADWKRTARARKPKLVGGSKQPVRAVRVVVDALRADFVKMALQGYGVSGVVPFAPQLREQAFAKKAGQKPTNAAQIIMDRGVAVRSLRPGERFLIHTHPFSTRLSVPDMAMMVRQFKRMGKTSNVIYVVDPTAAQAYFFKCYSETPIGDRNPKTVKRIAREAANRIFIMGKVVVVPSKNLRRIPKEKLERLVKYLDKKTLDFLFPPKEVLITSAADLRRGDPVWEQRVTESTRRNLRRYGQLFRTRYVPMSGYRFDRQTKQFRRRSF